MILPECELRWDTQLTFKVVFTQSLSSQQTRSASTNDDNRSVIITTSCLLGNTLRDLDFGGVSADINLITDYFNLFGQGARQLLIAYVKTRKIIDRWMIFDITSGSIETGTMELTTKATIRQRLQESVWKYQVNIHPWPMVHRSEGTCFLERWDCPSSLWPTRFCQQYQRSTPTVYEISMCIKSSLLHTLQVWCRWYWPLRVFPNSRRHVARLC